MHAFEYIFAGHGGWWFAPFMWTSVILAVVSLILLIPSRFRNNEKTLVTALIALIISTWLEKGMILVPAGFIPNPLEHTTQYFPTIPELMISVGIFAAGALVLTILFKIVLGVREETGAI